MSANHYEVQPVRRLDTLPDKQYKELLHDPEFWTSVIDDVYSDPHDLQRAKAEELIIERSRLIETLLERPAEAFMQEALYLQANCYARRAEAGNGEFFTRQNDSRALDSRTSIYERADGTILYRCAMFATGTYGYDQPAEIIASSNGAFGIFIEGHRNGIPVALDVTDKTEGQAILREYFDMSLKAASAVRSRGGPNSSENIAADNDAIERWRVLNDSELPYLRHFYI